MSNLFPVAVYPSQGQNWEMIWQQLFTYYLRDTTTFNDPYTGHRVTQQGQYDYWFTDRLGNYYGTNDPNFDPHSLRGEWFRITPLGR